MTTTLRSVEEVAALVRAGRVLVATGDPLLLGQLPAGRWLGGSDAHPEAGEAGRGLLGVTPLPDEVTWADVRVYDPSTIGRVYTDLADCGFGVMLVAAHSPTLMEFALHAPDYPGFAVRPLVGWVCGMPEPDPLGGPVVVPGAAPGRRSDGAVVLRVGLPPGRAAEIGVVNLFEPGDGPAITFAADAFEVGTAFVDGVEVAFADYVTRTGLDTRLPLVTDHGGVAVNVSFRAVDPAGGAVRFYSPVFAGFTYRHARRTAPLDVHAADLAPADAALACNCVLNHFYGQAAVPGWPLTFGEVAYQLLNQTFVHLSVTDTGRH